MSSLRRPIRVAMLTSVHPPLDTRIFHREATTAAAAGCDVLLIAPGAPAGPVDGVRFASLPAWGGRWARPLRWPPLFWKALRARADIYHFHDPELLPWGLLLKWTTGAAVVYDSHEYLREDISTKHWIPGWLRGPLAAFADRVQLFVARRIDAVVAVTEDMADRFRRVQPVVETIRNLPPTSVVDEPAGGREPVVMYAGLMSWDRGLEILKETATLVHAAHPEARFEIYGPIEWHRIDPEVAAMTAEEWGAIGVRFMGTVPYEEVPSTIARGLIGWLPRSSKEPNNLLAWPNKLVEYMASGLAIVASDLPTQAAVVAESETGLAVEADSAAAHAAAINQLLDNPASAKDFGLKGKEAARGRYTWETEAAKLQTLYTKLAGEKP